jgi:outer membrane protein OmpA-like peptidoglycan-associated protein/Tol biopolymer transport system component
MKQFYTIVFFFSFYSLNAQENGETSCLDPSKKVLKILQKASEVSVDKEAIALYKSALAEAPDNAKVSYEYAMFLYKLGNRYYETQTNTTMAEKCFESAEDLFLQTLDLCENYHANCSYCLGVIYYGRMNDEEALKWFNTFKAYKSEDVSKYPDDFDKKIKDVTAVITEMSEQQAVLDTTVPFEPQIVKNVSSKFDEYFPMISPDNELIFYTRKTDKTALGDIATRMIEEFTVSQRADILSDFDNGVALPLPFNDGTFKNYGSATLSLDNKEMIICACKEEDVRGQKYNNCDLYMTTYQRSGKGGNDFNWSPLVNLGPGVNTKDGWEAQPTLSADGKTLYFTATRANTKDNDIFVSKRNEDGTWGTAVPFDVVNTPGKDKSPFLHQDSETLYFVSSCTDSRKGIGGLDIFYIRKENGVWTEPKNIGFPINTAEDEIGLFVSIDGKEAFYSSRQGGDWNIYSFELYEEARPQPVAMIKGELKDDKGNPVSDASIQIEYENSDERTEIKVNGDDGKYAAIVKIDEAQDLMVTIKKEGAAFDSKLIAKESLGTADPVIRNNDLSVRELKQGEAYTINDILFATSSAELNETSKFILKSFAGFLKDNPTINVAIQGHTDDVGEENKNLILSENRAKSVMNYLVSMGVDANRLKAKGFGESKPKVPNVSEENRSKNRRTEFLIEKL